MKKLKNYNKIYQFLLNKIQMIQIKFSLFRNRQNNFKKKYKNIIESTKQLKIMNNHNNHNKIMNFSNNNQ